MKKESKLWIAISWFFGLLFIITGVLNVILVHIIPGISYLVFSLIFFPPVNVFLKEKIGFSIPIVVRIILGFFVLWATLAVGELVEILGG